MTLAVLVLMSVLLVMIVMVVSAMLSAMSVGWSSLVLRSAMLAIIVVEVLVLI
jgi:hypothetical protein